MPPSTRAPGKPAWLVKWKAGTYRVNFDLHRAGGLWLWAALLIFAWSSVYMNLADTVYRWVTKAVLDYQPTSAALVKLPQPLESPRLDWRSAQAMAERLMAEKAASHGFSVERPVSMGFDPSHGVYAYSVRSSRDIQDRRGNTEVFFDADTGDMRLLLLPSGQYAGNTVTSWLYALHMANVFGMPYRIFVCVLGLAITMLSVTGVYIWLKKPRARKFSASRRSLRMGAPRRSRIPLIALGSAGAQPRRGNPQLLGNLAQWPAAALPKAQLPQA